MEFQEIINYVTDNYVTMIPSIIGALLTGILSVVVYQLKGIITIVTKIIPMAMQSAERAFPDGHGDFKEEYVLSIIENKCASKKIKFRKRLFKFMIKLYVRMSKVINNKERIYTEDEVTEEVEK